jgi:hypothetical protein
MSEKKAFDGIELTALWKNQGKGWGGNLGGARILMFENDRAKENPSAPAFRLYVVRNEKRDKPAATEEAREPGSDDATAGDEPF